MGGTGGRNWCQPKSADERAIGKNLSSTTLWGQEAFTLPFHADMVSQIFRLAFWQENLHS